MNRSTLESLRLAVISAEYRSLRKAAAVLGMRQSTLSRHLRNLEIELGFDLFERSKSGTVPNESGQILIESVRRAMVDIDDAIARIKSAVRGESGHLIVGVGAAVSAGSVNSLLAEYRRRFSLVEIMITDQVGGLPVSEMTIHQVDVAIMMGHPVDGAGRHHSLWTERMVLVVPETHPLLVQTVVHWSDLAMERLLVSRRTPELARLASVMIRQGAADFIRVQDVGPDALPGLVKTGLGLALVTEGATGATHAGIVFREIHDDGGPTRAPFIARWRYDNTNPALKSFLDLLRDRYPDLSGTSYP